MVLGTPGQAGKPQLHAHLDDGAPRPAMARCRATSPAMQWRRCCRCWTCWPAMAAAWRCMPHRAGCCAWRSGNEPATAEPRRHRHPGASLERGAAHPRSGHRRADLLLSRHRDRRRLRRRHRRVHRRHAGDADPSPAAHGQGRGTAQWLCASTASWHARGDDHGRRRPAQGGRFPAPAGRRQPPPGLRDHRCAHAQARHPAHHPPHRQRFRRLGRAWGAASA